MGKTIGNTLDSAIKRPTPMNIFIPHITIIDHEKYLQY